MVVTALSVHDVVWDKLDAIANINAYDGEVPKTPPLDPDGRVHAYAVLFISAGRLYSTALDGAQGTMLASGYINCVGGQAFPIRFRDEDPGVLRRNDEVTPPRHWIQLEYQILAP
jgi:hypothetical protein